MSELDAERSLLSADSPAGVNLEYDPIYLALEDEASSHGGGALGDEDGVELWHVCRCDGRVEHHGHVKAFEHRVDHDARAASVQQKARAAQPRDRREVL